VKHQIPEVFSDFPQNQKFRDWAAKRQQMKSQCHQCIPAVGEEEEALATQTQSSWSSNVKGNIQV
jgi:hypothetical protein